MKRLLGCHLRAKSHHIQYLVGLLTFCMAPGTPPPMRFSSMKVKYDGARTREKDQRPAHDECSSGVSIIDHAAADEELSPCTYLRFSSTRSIFTECRRNRSPRPHEGPACFRYGLHAARSSARQNFRSHGQKVLLLTAFRHESICALISARAPHQKVPFLHIFLEPFRCPRGPPEPP